MQAYTYNCNLKLPPLLQKGQVVELTQGQGHLCGKEGVANGESSLTQGTRIISLSSFFFC